MAWRAFQSKHLNGGDYDPESRTLTIQFTNGAVYNYYGVPQTTADILFQTGSSQDYFNDHVRNSFRYVKVASGMSQSTGRRSRSTRF
jgi:hypothetical protein